MKRRPTYQEVSERSNMKLVVVLIIAVIAFAIWVRVAPSHPQRWNVALDEPQDRVLAHGVVRIVPGGEKYFGELDKIIRDTERTSHLAGTLEEGMVTYVTRSKLWGFPDYATVWVSGQDLVIHSRLRFGGGDTGVNRARVDNWLSKLPAS